MSDREVSRFGKVYFVGAGPGDPELLTLRGARCLAQADVVLYDYLVNARILRHVGRQAELLCLGRHGRDRIMSQSEINEHMVAAAQRGQTVVRLKGGDPAIFARLAEELEALELAGIVYEIVPGITTAQAVGAYAGIPLTDRDSASAVALVTGREGDKSTESNLDYEALARFPGTLVIYMGVTTAPHWTQALIDAGKPPHTPAAIVRRCSWPDQQIAWTNLSQVAAALVDRHIRPPVVIVIGDVAGVRRQANWFTSRPLFGRRVLVTRPRDQADAFATLLEDAGAQVVLQPAIEITPPPDWNQVDAALARLHEFDWLVFSSANGVRALLERLFALGGDLRRVARLRLAAIGPGTAAELRRFHLRADVVPEEFRAESLAAALKKYAPARLLLARASRGRDVLAEILSAEGAHVAQVVVYQSCDVPRPDPDVFEDLQAGRIDWVTVTSSAIAQSTVAMFGESLRQAKLASISPVTSATLRSLGFAPTAEARQYTLNGLVEAVVAADAAQQRPAG